MRLLLLVVILHDMLKSLASPCHRPKAKAMRPDVPFIMISAYGDAETMRKAIENGAEANCPLNFSDFIAVR